MPSRLALSVCLIGCGRVAFDPVRDAGPTGSIGQVAWLTPVVPAATGTAAVWSVAPDTAGGVYVAGTYQVGFSVNGASYPEATAGTDNGFAIALGADGQNRWVEPLHSGGPCDARAAAYDPVGGTVYIGGITTGPKLGDGNPCDLGNSLSEVPMVLGLDGSNGAMRSGNALQGSNGNSQLWNLTLPSFVIDGIYDGDLLVNGNPLPTAPACCSQTFVAALGATSWQWGSMSTGSVIPGVVDTLGGDTCVAGRMDAASTLFGVSVPAVGGLDVWVARLSPTGAPRFVRVLGTPGDDDYANVRATADGGCLVAFDVGGAFDAGGAIGVLPYAGGSDVVVATIDASGAITAATAIGGRGNEHGDGLVTIAGTSYVSLSFDMPVTIAGTLYTPAASDAAIVEVAGTVPTRVVTVLGGAGKISDARLFSDGSAMFVSGLMTGELTAGPYTASPSGSQGGYVVKLVP